MTSSYQSTAFQSSARPVDTFVRPPSVQPKTGIESLAETLVTINPNLQKFIGTKIDEAVENERRKGTRIALDAAKNSGEIKDIRKQIADSNGDEFANGLIGGSIFADDQFNKDITTLLGDEFSNQALSLYENKRVKTLTKDGREIEVPLSNFPLNSPQVQSFLEELNTLGGDLTQGLDENYILENFYPKQSKTLEKIITDHTKNHNLYKFDNLKKLSFSNISSAYVDYQNGNKEEAITKINDFIDNKVLLGITQDKTDKFFDALLNYTISLRDEAFNIDGLEGSKNVFEMMRGIKYGPNGASIFETHPEFLSKMHEQTIEHRKNLQQIEELNNKNKQNEAETLLLQAVTDLGTAEGDLPFSAIQRLRQFGTKYGVTTKWLDDKIDIFQPQRLQILSEFSLDLTKGKYLGQPNKGATDFGKILNSLGSLTNEELGIKNIIRTQLESNRKGQFDTSNARVDRIFDRLNLIANPKYNSIENFHEILEGNDPTSFMLELQRQFDIDFHTWKFYTKDNEGKYIVRNEEDTFKYLNEQEKELAEKVKEAKKRNFKDENKLSETQDITKTDDGVIIIDTDMYDALSKSDNYEKITIEGEEVLRNKNDNKTYKINPEVNSADFQGDPLNINRRNKINNRKRDNVEAGAFSDGGFTTITIESGDTLSGIANDLDTSMEAIMKANDITNANQIDAGDILLIPEGITDLNKINFIENLDKTKIITEQDHPYAPVRREHNFKVILELAKAEGIKYPELVAAQAMHESAYGDKKSSENNFLGLKATPSEIARGESEEKDTTEDRGQGLQPEKADFKKFENLKEMIRQYKIQWNDNFKDRKGTVNASTVLEALELIKAGDYATDEDYVPKVMNLLQSAKRQGWY